MRTSSYMKSRWPALVNGWPAKRAQACWWTRRYSRGCTSPRVFRQSTAVDEPQKNTKVTEKKGKFLVFFFVIFVFFRGDSSYTSRICAVVEVDIHAKTGACTGCASR